MGYFDFLELPALSLLQAYRRVDVERYWSLVLAVASRIQEVNIG